MSNVVSIERPPERFVTDELLLDQAQIEAQARWLIENRDLQPEVAVQRQEYQDNARTALMEALTATGHLSRVELSGSLEEINQQVMRRLLNGWDDALPEHEQKRRFAEVCEELVIQNVHNGIVAGLLSPDTAVGVISDCPVVEMPGIGYRYSNKKGMVRSTHLQYNTDGTYTRVIEQVSRSNSGAETSHRFLASCNIPVDTTEPADIATLRAPFIYTTQDFIDGVVDVQRRLDYYAGNGMRYGERVTDNIDLVDYHLLREESHRREDEIECYVDDLARLEAYLDKLINSGEIRRHQALQLFQEDVDRILSAICTLSPEYTEATFGAAAVPLFNEAADMAMRGELEKAQALIEANGHMKSTITFCGMSFSIEEAQKMGMPVSEYGDLVEKGKQNWKWKQGICRVETCSTRPGKTEVGPCSVCRNCQFNFDAPTAAVIRNIFAPSVKKQKAKARVMAKEDSTIKAA